MSSNLTAVDTFALFLRQFLLVATKTHTPSEDVRADAEGMVQERVGVKTVIEALAPRNVLL